MTRGHRRNYTILTDTTPCLGTSSSDLRIFVIFRADDAPNLALSETRCRQVRFSLCSNILRRDMSCGAAGDCIRRLHSVSPEESVTE